ncbi:hypothetical protein KIF53_03275 [Chromobacterium subtsugae]|uniref:Uncharacterized protein n=1 Tax=Chromobacterium subtsugae TaxID=251747 RepID=A0ABS7F981_9NEIS|nr:MULTISPECIES: hypothetical protein [Chromobacterium]KUM02611.1 hypothetical protein Cv017_02555 [Chromobacterium subtsugae]KZE87997.1 hypothetical protein AWB61_09390 [Chromobacterium sp. F49]MBW7565500.1 hypothetical protein [Chromobacterium subtsugae]MBW8286650.1 hypothetical protein [Chromobacterium subtsugae]OBU84471.1 hypothetical protein MY55_21955 [Chromobacterium subtsugae]
MKVIFEKAISRVTRILKGKSAEAKRAERRKYLASVCSDGVTISSEVEELLEQLFEQMSREEKSPMCSNGARVEIKM